MGKSACVFTSDCLSAEIEEPKALDGWEADSESKKSW